jgi:2-methylisocitrate lyase-like PEP mutase family enzyme
VLYAPGLLHADDIAAVTSSVDRPVNVVMGLNGARFSLAELSQLGVRRVSLGSTLSRVAFGAVVRAAEELQATGTFSFVDGAMPYQRINDMFAATSGASAQER